MHDASAGTPLTAEEVASVQLRIFDQFRRVCEANGITYFAYYGTLIGCVRHQGFIPWDDDIDVAVFRDDYEKLLGLDWAAEGLRLATYRNTPDFHVSYAKLCDPATVVVEPMLARYTGRDGVNIDIWPLDRVSGNWLVRTANDLAVRALRQLIELKWLARRAGRAPWRQGVADAVATLLRPLSMERLHAAVERLIVRRSGSLIGCRLGGVGPEQWMPPEWFTPPATLTFEGRQVSAPREYDSILRQIFGDYLQLPPESQRVRHGFVAYRPPGR